MKRRRLTLGLAEENHPEKNSLFKKIAPNFRSRLLVVGESNPEVSGEPLSHYVYRQMFTTCLLR